MSTNARTRVGSAVGSESGSEDEAALRVALGVWIDQDLCTGDGLCIDHVPSVFTILEDGIAYCKEESPGHVKVFNDPGGAFEFATVPTALEADVIQAASVCPGECIFVEILDRAPQVGRAE